MGCRVLTDALHQLDGELQVVAHAVDVKTLLEVVSEAAPDVCLVSGNLAEGALAGVSAVRELHLQYPDLPIIVLLDHCDAALVVDVFRNGARGIFQRTDRFDILPTAIRCVQAGQVWAGNTHISYLLDALSASRSIPIRNVNGETLLTDRQQQIADLVAEGLGNREISERLHLSEHTVKNYLFRIFEKLGVSTRAELMLYTLSQRERGGPPIRLSKSA
jgi:DNA-binding NarL/FixJ family response regulator